MLTRFLKDDAGATAIEYALLAALIGLAIVAGATFLGTSLDGFFNSIGNTLAESQPG